MQAIAKELHLSETTFVLPPTSTAADHRVRMFTPDAELPFAGHPTIGTAFVLADGKDGALRLEEGVGVIGVTLRDGFVQMEQPLPAFTGTTITRKAAAEALGLAIEEVRSDIPIQMGSSGVPFLFVPLANLKAVRRARRPGGLDASVYAFAMSGERSGSHVHGRMFDQGLGIGLLIVNLDLSLVRLRRGVWLRIVSEYAMGKPQHNNQKPVLFQTWR